MEDITLFITRIPEFNNKTAGQLIPFFAYYLINISQQKTIQAVDVKKCFTDLAIIPYSNISSYLSVNSSGKQPIFIKQKNGYVLHRNSQENITKELNAIIELPLSDDLLSIEIFDQARYYHKIMAKQMIQCYDIGFYDASLVMMRKLLETLIIESFERHGIEDSIKDNNGVFLYLSDLIPIFLTSKKWNTSRNLNSSIKKIKKYGDLSAHNRRFIAKKSDFIEFKFELRQAIQEILLIIDYPNWK